MSSKIPRIGGGISAYQANNSNMAYVNITGEGNKPVGPIGLKKAEKDLIMRRYKAQ